MPILIPNSRDIGDKFLFGHWMMRNRNSGVSFKGPGYGRVNYWMYTPEYSSVSTSMKLNRIEEEMKLMKKLKLKCYVIELCGKIEIGDDCWVCCDKDVSLLDTLDEGIFEEGGPLKAGWEPDWSKVKTSYFTDIWYQEALIKYKALIKLCRKYDLWLLVLCFNDNRWQKAGLSDREIRWIAEYGKWSPGNQEAGSNSGGPEHGPGTRQEELRMAIKHAFEHAMPPDIPSYKNLETLMQKVVFPAGGQERVAICPVNEPETADGTKFEREWIPRIKGHGFASCTYNEIKYNAKFYQGGHDSSIESVKCPKGFGVSDNGKLLCELYFGTSDADWEEIKGSDLVVEGQAKKLIKNYKKSGARAAMLYAIHYSARSPDENALKEIKEGWEEA